MSKQPVKPASANDSAQPRAKGTPSATATAPPAQSSPPNWFSCFPPGEFFLAEPVRCSLLIDPGARSALLNISPDNIACVELELELTDCKSLHDRLRETAADCRVVNAFTDVQPRPEFLFNPVNPVNPVNPAPASNKHVRHHSHLRSLEVSAAYRLNVVILRGVATSGEWFRSYLPAEIAEALAHDLARAIARLEGRTPL